MIQDAADIRVFNFLVSSYPQHVTADTFDQVYFQNNWIMLSILYLKTPRLFITWVFGTYLSAGDPEVIQNLKHVMVYLSPDQRDTFCNILSHYHDWLWRYTPTGALQCIQSLNEFLTLNPEIYIGKALDAPDNGYLEFLILRKRINFEEPSLMKRVRNTEKMRMIWTAAFDQKAEKIMILLIILILATFIGTFSNNFSLALL